LAAATAAGTDAGLSRAGHADARGRWRHRWLSRRAAGSRRLRWRRRRFSHSSKPNLSGRRGVAAVNGGLALLDHDLRLPRFATESLARVASFAHRVTPVATESLRPVQAIPQRARARDRVATVRHLRRETTAAARTGNRAQQQKDRRERPGQAKKFHIPEGSSPLQKETPARLEISN
jgi:hypothetical protein